MWVDQSILKLSNKMTYSRDDLFHIMQSDKTDLSDSAFRWTLYNLLKEQKLFKTGRDAYETVKPKDLPIYTPYYSEKASILMKKLSNQYPELEFVIFESVLLNEFLNHQIAQNTIYIQVEKDVSSYVFDRLHEEYAGNVLYKPGKSEFDKYWSKDCVVVLDLISQAPMSQNDPHEITLEKMLVDIISEKSISETFSPSEIPHIFEEAINSYKLDKRKMNRYAGRRGKTSQINKYIGGN